MIAIKRNTIIPMSQKEITHTKKSHKKPKNSDIIFNGAPGPEKRRAYAVFTGMYKNLRMKYRKG
ncbi:MAG: hypothetical protein Q8N60_04955 [Candidatus Diapherotrites archaeon]|nr:hypothetical protein [Candidatus Diapherotrites archaeon]